GAGVDPDRRARQHLRRSVFGFRVRPQPVARRKPENLGNDPGRGLDRAGDGAAHAHAGTFPADAQLCFRAAVRHHPRAPGHAACPPGRRTARPAPRPRPDLGAGHRGLPRTRAMGTGLRQRPADPVADLRPGRARRTHRHADRARGLKPRNGRRPWRRPLLSPAPARPYHAGFDDFRGDEAMSNPFMQAAIEEARRGLAEGGIPIGSVIEYRGEIIGRGHNQRVQKGSAILHGEMDALENAGRRTADVYRESTLYTTLSPCAMCSGTILLYGIPRVVIGENQTFMGEEELLRSRGVRIEVLQDPECLELMRRFIAEHPSLWNEDIGV